MRFILFIIFTLSAITGWGQEKIFFSPSKWDFGTIREQDGTITHTFVGRNTSEKPIILLNIVSSCGCTVPQFSRRPILPGEETEVIVRFNPQGQFGNIARDLLVYSSEREKIATLQVRGKVTPRPRSVEEDYPIEAGGGVRLGRGMCNFPNIYIGSPTTSTIPYINHSEKEVRVELRPRQQSGHASVMMPQKIQPHEKGEINFTYYIKEEASHYGTLTDVWEVWVDSKTSHTLLMAHGISVDDPRKSLSKKKGRMQVSKNIVKFGVTKHTNSPYVQTVRLTNVGDKELVIRAVEVKGDFRVNLTQGTRITQRKSIDVKLSLNTHQQKQGAHSGQILLISSDPIRPIQRIKVTYFIE